MSVVNSTVLSQGTQSSAIYILRNPDGVSAHMNDPNSPFNVGIVSSDAISGLDSPEVRDSAELLTEFHGAVQGRNWYGRRPVTIPLDVVDPEISSREDMLQRARRASNLMDQDGQLIWFPGDPEIVSVTRENLVPNPSFEWDETGTAAATWTYVGDAQWTSRSFNATSTTFSGSVGSQTGRMRGTKDANTTNRTLAWSTPVDVLDSAQVAEHGMKVTPGLPYTARAKVNVADAPAAGAGLQLKIVWCMRGGFSIGTSLSNAVTGTGTATLTITGATAPAGAERAVLVLQTQSTGNADVIDIYVDALQMVQESSAGTYFDGDTANCTWIGRVGEATSINRPNGRLLNVRRQDAVRISNPGIAKSIFLPLVASDPRIYSARQKYTFNDVGSFGAMQNDGDHEALPQRLRLHGPISTDCTFFIYGHGTTGSGIGQITLTHGTQLLTVGQYIDIDMVTRTVVRDNGESRYGNIDFAQTRWNGAVPGGNLTGWVLLGGTVGTSIAEVLYRDTWM